MKRCPHCNQLLLSTKERLPAKLSPLQKKILEFCKKPRKSTEIAEHIGSSMSGTYKSLRLLQRLDQLEKVLPAVSKGHNYDVKFLTISKPAEEPEFVATNKPLFIEPEFMRYLKKPMVLGVRL
jgi:hypothetical protein